MCPVNKGEDKKKKDVKEEEEGSEPRGDPESWREEEKRRGEKWRHGGDQRGDDCFSCECTKKEAWLKVREREGARDVSFQKYL